MVFPSVPIYIDPSNWQQQQNHQQGSGGENPHLPPQPPPPQQVGGGGAGSIRPGSMTDRARLAKLPQPEAGLKCPRCESVNTKFCYFNNYNLSQPRHFCKACRRYWTRGGALRNVPVGGGCRRNKKSKNRNSKSPATTDSQTGPNSTAEVMGHLPPQLPFMGSSLHNNITQYGGGNLGLSFGSISTNFQNIGSNLDAGQWRLQQFSSLGGLNPITGLDPFEGAGVPASTSYDETDQIQTKMSCLGVNSLTLGKMEETPEVNLLSRQFFNVNGNDQYWVGNSWTDFPGVSSSSSSHLH